MLAQLQAPLLDTQALLLLAAALIAVLAIVAVGFRRRAARESDRLRASEMRFRYLADAAFEGLLVHRHGIIEHANRAFCTLVERSAAELAGTSGFPLIAPPFHEPLRAWLQDNDAEPMELDVVTASGELVPVEIHHSATISPDDQFRVIAVRDLRERKQALERINHLAHHDPLTGLPNRKLFLERLGHTMSMAQRAEDSAAVMCLDLDRFKQVNDLLGHWAGDALLCEVARRLEKAVRGHDTVARLGGDEFGIVQLGADAPHQPAALAERLVRILAEPFDLNGQQVLIGASIGIALFPGDGNSGEDLLRAADTALYRAKESGRNGFRFFEAGMDQRLQERAALERDLRAALINEQLEVHYQPLVDCESGAIVGYEALVRWNDPQRGAVSPAEFIPLAEESGLILPLGNWVLRTACKEAMNWPDSLKVAVNLSPAQFRHGDLARDILDALAETRLPALRLEVEITESVLITDTATTLRILTQLKDAGVRIALDDFGTGYSSLSYLQRFPFDKIKIDRSFVWQMQESRESMSIVRAVIALGHSLQITVTAEGVETDAQLSLLQSEQCDQVQGYLLGRPGPEPMRAFDLARARQAATQRAHRG